MCFWSACVRACVYCIGLLPSDPNLSVPSASHSSLHHCAPRRAVLECPPNLSPLSRSLPPPSPPPPPPSFLSTGRDTPRAEATNTISPPQLPLPPQLRHLHNSTGFPRRVPFRHFYLSQQYKPVPSPPPSRPQLLLPLSKHTRTGNIPLPAARPPPHLLRLLVLRRVLVPRRASSPFTPTIVSFPPSSCLSELPYILPPTPAPLRQAPAAARMHSPFRPPIPFSLHLAPPPS